MTTRHMQGDELAGLVERLHDTQQRIVELTDGSVDSVLHPSGASYLLSGAQDHLRETAQTSRRLAEERAAIIDSLPANIALLDPDGRIVAVNAAWRRFASANGMNDQTAAIGKNYLTICDEAEGEEEPDARAAAMGIRDVFSGRSSSFWMEYPCPGPEGPRWFRLIVSPLIGQAQRGAVVMHDDITDRYLATERLRESEARFRAVARATTDVVWDWDLISSEHWVGSDFEPAFGHSLTELEPTLEAWAALIHPEDRERVVRGLKDCVAQRREVWRDHYRYRHGDGSFIEVEDRGYLLKDVDGTPRRMVGGMSDVTESMRVRAQLAEQAALLDEVEDAIVVRNLDDRVLSWNQAAERIYGWTAEEMLGQSMAERLQEDPEISRRNDTVALAEGHWQGQVQHRCKDGNMITVRASRRCLLDKHGEPRAMMMVCTDITGTLALQEQLSRAQRLESIGQLTGGIAHDFNNLLTVILGNAEELANGERDPGAIVPIAKMIQSAAERGADLTRRLLAFARRQSLAPKAVDIDHLLVHMEKLLRRVIHEHTELSRGDSRGLWPALVDPGQLENAVLNLCINARDAMPEGGRLFIETANVSIDDRQVAWGVEAAAGDYVMLSIGDEGCGIPAAVLSRVFDPFFTTKEEGKGSGLGLSMVYGFVKQSGGHVQIASVEGRGTTVQLYLPRAEVEPKPADKPGAAAAPVGGSEKVLLVEDDELLRQMAAKQLAILGYEVVAAADGPEALGLLESDRPFDLLLTDIVMPGGMSGRQLAERARAMRPGLAVLLSSGYADDVVYHEGRFEPGVHLLNKPYRRKELAEKVREALADRS